MYLDKQLWISYAEFNLYGHMACWNVCTARWNLYDICLAEIYWLKHATWEVIYVETCNLRSYLLIVSGSIFFLARCAITRYSDRFNIFLQANKHCFVCLSMWILLRCYWIACTQFQCVLCPSLVFWISLAGFFVSLAFFVFYVATAMAIYVRCSECVLFWVLVFSLSCPSSWCLYLCCLSTRNN